MELEASAFERRDYAAFAVERYDDVVREVGRDKKDGAGVESVAGLVPMLIAVSLGVHSTYIPAMASGLVNSNTRFPASKPSPMTCIAM